MYRNKYISAVITAAGFGLRMGAGKPKLEIEINRKPIINYTVETFEDLEIVDEIILVTNKFLLSEYKKRFSSRKTKVVLGGQTREDSTYEGLKNLSDKSDMVICHDGARPFVKKEDIIRVLEKAIDTGAAILGVSATDTIKVISKDHEVLDTPDRSTLYNIQTPQVFYSKDIKKAYDKYLGKIRATDDSAFIEKLGKTVSLVEGSYDNIKVTTKKDLEIGRILCE